MKRGILFLLLILAFQIGYKIAPVLAQRDKDALEIKKVVEDFLESFANWDLNSTMNQVSINYFDKQGDNIIDYAKFKSMLENRINNRSKTYVDYSISELQLYNLDIQDNKATVEAEWSWKGYNLDTLKEDSGKQKRSVSLAKENGSWKITQLRQLKQSEQ